MNNEHPAEILLEHPADILLEHPSEILVEHPTEILLEHPAEILVEHTTEILLEHTVCIMYHIMYHVCITAEISIANPANIFLLQTQSSSLVCLLGYKSGSGGLKSAFSWAPESTMIV